MKFYQDSGFKWTVASTLVLASIIGMTTFAAHAAPPLANPPGGNISPKFSNLETAVDVIVGQNLKVGGDIRPASGNSFALNADKVNFTKDVEAKGLVTAVGGVTTNIISSALNYVRINQLQINKPVIAGTPTALSAYNAVPLATSDSLSFGFGGSGLSVKKGPNGSGKLTTDGDLRTNANLYTDNNLFVTGVANMMTGGIKTLLIKAGESAQNDITLDGNTTTINSPQFALGNQVEFNSDFLNTYSNPTKSAFTGDVGVGGKITGSNIVSNGNIDATAGTITGKSIVSNGNISATAGTITGYNISATNYLKAAKSIGAWTYPSSGNRKVSGVNKTGAAATIDATCVAPAKIISCEAVTADPLENIEVRSRVITGGANTTCYVVGMSKTAAEVTYAAQATCFDPSWNN